MSRILAPTNKNSTMYAFIDTRMNYLKCLMNHELGCKGTTSHTKASGGAADAIIAQLAKGSLLSPDDTVHILEAIGQDNPFTETDRIRVMESITSRVDLEGQSSTAPADMVSHFNPHPEKQQHDFIENYLTEKIWGDLSAAADRGLVVSRVGKLLVDLGILHPKEKLFAMVTSLIEHCYRGYKLPTIALLNVVKAEYKFQRDLRQKQALQQDSPTGVGPMVYPVQPSELKATHAHLYHQAYTSSHPIPVPTWVDFEMLKLRMAAPPMRVTNAKMMGPNPMQGMLPGGGGRHSHHQAAQFLDPKIGLKLMAPSFQRQLQRSSTMDADTGSSQEIYAGHSHQITPHGGAPAPLALPQYVPPPAPLPLPAPPPVAEAAPHTPHPSTSTSSTTPGPSVGSDDSQSSSLTDGDSLLDELAAKIGRTFPQPEKKRKTPAASPPKTEAAASAPLTPPAVKKPKTEKDEKHTPATVSPGLSAKKEKKRKGDGTPKVTDSKPPSSKLPGIEFPGMKKFAPIYCSNITIYHFTVGLRTGCRVKNSETARRTKKFGWPTGGSGQISHTA